MKTIFGLFLDDKILPVVWFKYWICVLKFWVWCALYVLLTFNFGLKDAINFGEVISLSIVIKL